MSRRQSLTRIIIAVLALLVLSTCAPQRESDPAATSAPSQAPDASTTTEVQAAALPTTTEHPFAGRSDWIAFQRGDSSGRIGVWLIHPDGSEEHQIFTDVEAEVRNPSWSADGTRLVVSSLGGDTSEPLYEYDLESNTSRELFPCSTDDPCYHFFDEPSYSPDGKSVAFIRYDGGLAYSEAAGATVPISCGLWIGDIASGELTQVTNHADDCDREYYPRWSPDGTQFLYTHDPYAKGKPTGTMVYVMSADGSGKRQLTDPTLVAGDAAWSPDGQWIVFTTYPLFEYGDPPGPSNLYRVRLDGSGLEQLTFNETTSLRAALPHYSPDGEWIIFTSVTPSERSLWAMPAAGGEPVVIAQGRGQPNNYTFGVWQPSGVSLPPLP